jgi:hypothetical protein
LAIAVDNLANAQELTKVSTIFQEGHLLDAFKWLDSHEPMHKD